MESESVKTPVEAEFLRTRDDDREIAGLAGRQHGVVARRQLAAMGFRDDSISVRLRNGRLHRVHAGVYSLAPRQLLTRQGWWMAAVLASGPEALISHRTAAVLWEIRGSSGGAVHVTVPHKTTSTKQIRRHFSPVPEDERAVEEGIPATSVHRTIFDLAASLPLDDVMAMIKEAEYRNRYDRLSLPDLLERYPGKRGSRKLQLALKRITEEPGGPKRSRLEQRFAPFLRRHDLPQPRFNDPIVLGSKL